MIIQAEANVVKVDEFEERTNYLFKLHTDIGKNETINDFHLFCMQITMDVIMNKFRTNEFGDLSYNVEYEDETKFVAVYLDALMNKIMKEKTDFNQSLNDLIDG